MRVRCAVVLGIAGVIGTVVVLTGALAPGVMAPVLPWVTVFLFALGFVGVPVLIVTNVADRIPSRRRTPRHEHSAPRVGREFWRRRRWLAVLLGSCVAISVVTVAVTLVATGGWSPNGRWALKRCQWSLGTNHGFTNICVSHDRWLATNNEVGLVLLRIRHHPLHRLRDTPTGYFMDARSEANSQA